MGKLQAILKFLSSLWGALASATILFPGVATLLKIPIAVENSSLKTLYPTISSVLAAFFMLLLISYRTELASLKTARKVAVLAICIATISLFCFIGIRVYFLDIQKEVQYTSNNKVIIEAKNKGIIRKSEKNLFADPVSHMLDGNMQEYSDPTDVLALALFSLFLSALSVAFGALGINAYMETITELTRSGP